jgi:hypothetical protein
VGNDCFWLTRDVYLLEETLVFILEERIQPENFSNFQKKDYLVEIKLSLHPYVLKDLM